jgi:hypothetical protein
MCLNKHIIIVCCVFVVILGNIPTFSYAIDKELLGDYPELLRLKEFDSTLELNMPPDISKDEMFPTPSQLNILFTAIRYCRNDLGKMQDEFPDLFAIFRPEALDNLDDDDELEVVMNLSGYKGDSTWIWIAEPYAGAYRYVEYEDQHRMVTEVIITKEKEIVLRRPGSKNIPIKGTNNLVTIEFVLQTVIKFTGKTIEVIRPYEIVDECLIP